VALDTRNQRNGPIYNSKPGGWLSNTGRMPWYQTHRGFTIIELMICIAIIGILAAMASLVFAAYRQSARVSRAVSDIHTIQNAITSYEIVENQLPADLSEIRWDTHNDPWGHPYQYTNFETVPKGKWRRDKSLTPINSTYDLWSMGPDGQSQNTLLNPVSKDDIIRANDGLYIGIAALY
jgi:general secretion pathway protein G